MLYYKILALDIDDTLTLSVADIPEENLRAIKRAQEAGLYVTLATGRGFLGSTPIWEKLGIVGPIINFGGACMHDTRTGEAIYIEKIPSALVQDVLETAYEWDVHAHIYNGHEVIFEKRCTFSDVYCRYQTLPNREVPDIRERAWTEVPKILYITEPERVRELVPLLTKKYWGKLKISESKAGFIEFNCFGVDKGTALMRLAADMGVSQAQTVAVGDNTLDLEMIRCAGLGVAVGNAQEAIREAADMVVPDCADCGVAWLIDNILLREV